MTGESALSGFCSQLLQCVSSMLVCGSGGDVAVVTLGAWMMTMVVGSEACLVTVWTPAGSPMIAWRFPCVMTTL